MDSRNSSVVPSSNHQAPPAQAFGAAGTPGQVVLMGEDELDLRQILSVLRRRALVVAGVASVVMSLVIATTLWQQRIYEGKFRLLVEPVNADNDFSSLADILTQQGGLGNSPTGKLDYDTQIQVLRSPELLQKVIQPLKELYPDITYRDLVNALTIVRPKETKILEVRYRSGNPDQVETVLQQLAAKYLDYSLVERQTNLRQGIQFIDEQLPDLQQQVDSLQLELQQFRQRYNFIDPNIQASQISSQTSALKAEQLDLEQEIAKARSNFQTLQQENGALAALKDAQVYQQLVSQLRKIETDIATELTRFQPQSLNIRILQEQRQNLLPVLQQEAQRVVGTKLADAATQLQILQVRSQALNQAQAELDATVKEMPALSRHYSDLQRELQIATEGLNRFLANRQTLQVQAAQTEIPWQVIEAPLRPEDPISPNIKRNLALGLVASSLLGVGAALLLEKLDSVYHSSLDLKEKTKLPLLGTIPYQEQYEIQKTPQPLSLVQRLNKQVKQFIPNAIQSQFRQLSEAGTPYGYSAYSISNGYGKYYGFSGFSEALRVLHTNLQLLSTDRPIRSIVVTSALPGDGKSTISLNLAQTAVTLGQRVLLIDADMRRPRVHERMGLTNLDGLSNAISSEVDVPSIFHYPIPLAELAVLTSGPLPPDPAKLLASQKQQQLMQDFEKSFDLVIYDTPPLLGLADASLIASHTDGIVLVVCLDKTDRLAVSQAIDVLKQAKIPLLGVVANSRKSSRSNSYGYYQSHYTSTQRTELE